MNWRYYEKRSPKEVEDGIEAQSKRGDIGEQWLSRRFIDVVESYSKSNRITRGKRYARKGQVVDLTVENGVVSATVQGSRADPYDITTGKAIFDSDAATAEERSTSQTAGQHTQIVSQWSSSCKWRSKHSSSKPDDSISSRAMVTNRWRPFELSRQLSRSIATRSIR